MVDGYTSRTYQPGDETALIALYNHITGRSRTEEQWRWEWLDTPEGQGSIWVIEEESTNKIVGHHGLIPVRLSYFGQPVLSGKTENTMVQPEYRGKIGYTSFEKQFLEEAASRYDLTFATSGSGAPGRVRTRLGYFSIGGYAAFLYVDRKSDLDTLMKDVIHALVKNPVLSRAAIAFTWLADWVLIRFFGARRSIDPTVRLDRVDDIHQVEPALDAWWERNRSAFGITTSRHARYLQWRLFDNPNTTYDFYVAKRGTDLIGIVAVECTAAQQATICDMAVEGNQETLFDTVLQLALRTLADKDVHVIMFPTLRSDNSLNRSLARNGFRSFAAAIRWLFKLLKKEEVRLLVRILDPELDESRVADPGNWYFTSLLAEGLRSSGSLVGSLERR